MRTATTYFMECHGVAEFGYESIHMDPIEAVDLLVSILARKDMREREANVALECRRVLLAALMGTRSNEVHITI